MEYLREDQEDTRKILFTGLDDAGKTSIIYALQREFGKIAVLRPTRGAQKRIFNFMGRSVSEWDLGGQISYRISYLKKPGLYFDDTEIAIYVIDIQNKQRYEEAVNFLIDVVKKFHELEVSPFMYIFLHKSDPIIKEDDPKGYKIALDKVKRSIELRIEPKDLKYFETSIYDLPHLVSTMSKILLDLHSIGDLINKSVEEFSKKTNALSTIIYDHNSLVLGAYYKNDEIKNVMNSSGPFLLGLCDTMEKTKGNMGNFKHSTVFKNLGKCFVLRRFNIDGLPSPWSLILAKDDEDVDDSHILALMKLLRKMMLNN